MFRAVRPLLFGGVSGKVLGVARELVSAALFGTGLVASAYRLAQQAFFIPVQGFLSDSLTSGFTPTYARDRQADLPRAQALFAGMHGVLLIGTSLIAALIIYFADLWVGLLAPGFDARTAALATQMVRLMACSMPLYAVTSLYAAADLAAGNAVKTAVRATIQSAGLIGGTVCAWWLRAPVLIPAGFVAAYLVLALWGATSAVREGLRLWPRRSEWDLTRSAVGVVWRAYRVLIWVPVLMQIHFVVERRLASVLDSHAVAALDYARFVSDTAVLLLAMPFALAGLAAMPAATEDEYRRGAWQSLRLLLYVGVPVSVAFSVHAGWAVRVAYGRGAFDTASIEVTTAILQTLAIGLFAQLIGYAGLRFLSARGRNRDVLAITVAGALVNIILNLTVSSRLGVGGIGAAYSVNVILVGGLILLRLGILKPLVHDLVSLAFAAAAYLAVWEVIPADVQAGLWAAPLVFSVYWSLYLTLVPRSRKAVGESWRLVRLAR